MWCAALTSGAHPEVVRNCASAIWTPVHAKERLISSSCDDQRTIHLSHEQLAGTSSERASPCDSMPVEAAQGKPSQCDLFSPNLSAKAPSTQLGQSPRAGWRGMISCIISCITCMASFQGFSAALPPDHFLPRLSVFIDCFW